MLNNQNLDIEHTSKHQILTCFKAFWNQNTGVWLFFGKSRFSIGSKLLSIDRKSNSDSGKHKLSAEQSEFRHRTYIETSNFDLL